METETKRCKACNLYWTSEGFRPGRAVCRTCEREADRARRAKAKHGAEPEAPAPEAHPQPGASYCERCGAGMAEYLACELPDCGPLATETPAPEVAPEPEAVHTLTGDEALAAMQHCGPYLQAIEGEPSPIMQMRTDYGIDRGPDYSIRVRDRFARRIPDPRADELAGREVWRDPPPRIEPPPMKVQPAPYSPPARIANGKTYCIKGLRP